MEGRRAGGTGQSFARARRYSGGIQESPQEGRNDFKVKELRDGRARIFSNLHLLVPISMKVMVRAAHQGLRGAAC